MENDGIEAKSDSSFEIIPRDEEDDDCRSSLFSSALQDSIFETISSPSYIFMDDEIDDPCFQNQTENVGNIVSINLDTMPPFLIQEMQIAPNSVWHAEDMFVTAGDISPEENSATLTTSSENNYPYNSVSTINPCMNSYSAIGSVKEDQWAMFKMPNMLDLSSTCDKTVQTIVQDNPIMCDKTAQIFAQDIPTTCNKAVQTFTQGIPSTCDKAVKAFSSIGATSSESTESTLMVCTINPCKSTNLATGDIKVNQLSMYEMLDDLDIISTYNKAVQPFIQDLPGTSDKAIQAFLQDAITLGDASVLDDCLVTDLVAREVQRNFTSGSHIILQGSGNNIDRYNLIGSSDTSMQTFIQDTVTSCDASALGRVLVTNPVVNQVQRTYNKDGSIFIGESENNNKQLHGMRKKQKDACSVLKYSAKMYKWIRNNVHLQNLIRGAKSSFNSLLSTFEMEINEILGVDNVLNLVIYADETDLKAIENAFCNAFNGQILIFSGSGRMDPTIPTLPVGYGSALEAAQAKINVGKQLHISGTNSVVVTTVKFVAEIVPQRWQMSTALCLEDPNIGLNLHNFSQTIPVPNEYIHEAQRLTPISYTLKGRGFAVTVQEAINSVIEAESGDTQEFLTGVDHYITLKVAADILAGMYYQYVTKMAE